MDLDTTNWSGEGAFTQTLIDSFQGLDQVACLRVEDAPSSRSDVEYNFISNELFVAFRTQDRAVHAKWLGLVPVTRTVTETVMTVTGLERALSELDEVGPPGAWLSHDDDVAIWRYGEVRETTKSLDV